MREGILPLAVMERVIKSVANFRVSNGAKIALRTVLEEKAIEISKKAKVLAEHSKRTTIKSEDIKLAVKQN